MFVLCLSMLFGIFGIRNMIVNENDMVLDSFKKDEIALPDRMFNYQNDNNKNIDCD